MKKLLITVGLAIAMSGIAYAGDDKEEPKTKQVCVDVQGKDGKPVIDPKTKKPKQQCTTVKVRKKHEGTEIPPAKK